MAKPYWKEECTIQCCTNCVPPKRHIGCHATCKDYAKEKLEWEENKKKIKDNMAKVPNISAYDFEKNSFTRVKHRNKHKH